MSEDLGIDELVPEKIYRLTHHYHNLLYIRYVHEQWGSPPPKLFIEELQRIDEHWHNLVAREYHQGGHFRKGKK